MRKLNGNILDRTGIRYNRLIAIEIDHTKLPPEPLHWICQCDCGKMVSVRSTNLISNNTKSCGCANDSYRGYQEISQSTWYRITNKAKKRQITFDTTIEYIWNLYIKQNKKCALSGIDICFVRNIDHYWEQTASLDRIDPNKGYIDGNLQWVHKDINQLKHYLSQQEFIFWCKAINQEDIDMTSPFIEQSYTFKKGRYSLYHEISLRYWQTVIQSAYNRDKQFDITVEQAWNQFIKQNKKCAITKVPLKFVADYRYHQEYQTASLDRINNEKPYEINNIHWVHKKINRIKHKHSLEYIQNWAKLVSNHYDYTNSKS